MLSIPFFYFKRIFNDKIANFEVQYMSVMQIFQSRSLKVTDSTSCHRLKFKHAKLLFMVSTNKQFTQWTPKPNSLFRWQSQRRTSEWNSLLIVVYMFTPTPQNPYNHSKVRERQREIRGLRHQFSLIRLTTLSLFLTYCSLHTLHVRLVEITVSLVYRQWVHVLRKCHAGVS
jgi:VanZ family protein